MTTTGLSLNKAQIAELGGVSRPAATKWANAEDFPRPVPGIGTPSSPRYRADEVRTWMKANGKKIAGDDAYRALWAAMNAWRDHGLDYRDGVSVVTSLIVWRYVSDPASPGFYRNLPTEFHWQSWRNWTTSNPLEEIQRGMEYFEYETDKRGLFDSLKDSAVLRSPRDLRGSLYPVLDALGMIGPDDFVETFEAFYDRVTEATGKSAGEFATSKDLVALAAHALADIPGPVHDPVAGTGRLLLTAAKEGTHRTPVTGQEINGSSRSMALQRALLYGVDNFDVYLGDTLSNDAFAEGHAQVVVMNPPYGLRNPADLTWDQRFIFGAPKRVLDLAWPQIGIWHLGPGGRCACYLPTGSLFRGGEEAQIRQNMLKSGSVEAVVALPAGIAIATQIPLTLWILARPGEAADPDRVLLIDQTDHGDRLDRTTVTVDTPAVAEALRVWRRNRTVPGNMPATAVSVKDILAAGGDLTPHRWMKSSAEAPEATNVRDQLAALRQATQALSDLQLQTSVEIKTRTAPVAQSTVGQLIKDGRIEQLRPKYRVSESNLSNTEGTPVVTGNWIRRSGPVDSFVDPALMEQPVFTKPGDVLVQTLGGLASRVDEEGGKILHTSTYQLLRVLDENLIPAYLAEIISTEHNLNSHSHGVSQRRVKITDLPVPLLPRAEQDALVTVLTATRALNEQAKSLAAKARATRNDLTEAVAAGSVQVTRD